MIADRVFFLDASGTSRYNLCYWIQMRADREHTATVHTQSDGVEASKRMDFFTAFVRGDNLACWAPPQVRSP